VWRESVCDHRYSSSSLQGSRDDEWQAAVEQMHLVIFLLSLQKKGGTEGPTNDNELRDDPLLPNKSIPRGA
jgi:hypothetical protein